MTTSKAIEDVKSHLDLAAGTNKLNGEQALGLVRAPQERRRRQRPGPNTAPAGLHQGAHRPGQGRRAYSATRSGCFDVADTATKAITTDQSLGEVNSPAWTSPAASGASGSPGHPHDHDAGAGTTRPTPTAWSPIKAKAEHGLDGDAGRTGRSRPPRSRTRRATRARRRASVGRSSEGPPSSIARRRPARGPIRAIPPPGRSHPLNRSRPDLGFGTDGPVLADWYVGPGSRTSNSAPATRRPPETRRHLEARHPPRVRRDPGQLHLWRVVHHPQHDHERQHPCRGLLRVPPVLHGQAEDPRHRWPRGPLRGPLRQGAAGSKK